MGTAKDIPEEALKEYTKVGILKEYDQSVKQREEHDRHAKEKRNNRRSY